MDELSKPTFVEIGILQGKILVSSQEFPLLYIQQGTRCRQTRTHSGQNNTHHILSLWFQIAEGNDRVLKTAAHTGVIISFPQGCQEAQRTGFVCCFIDLQLSPYSFLFLLISLERVYLHRQQQEFIYQCISYISYR